MPLLSAAATPEVRSFVCADIMHNGSALPLMPRLCRRVRHGGRYACSPELLALAKELLPEVVEKSGMMVGLGEEWEEVEEVLRGLRGCRAMC